MQWEGKFKLSCFKTLLVITRCQILRTMCCHLPALCQMNHRSCRCGSWRASLGCGMFLAHTATTQRLAHGCHTNCPHTETGHSASWALLLPPAAEDRLPGCGWAACAGSGCGLHSGSAVTVCQSVTQHNTTNSEWVMSTDVHLTIRGSKLYWILSSYFHILYPQLNNE